MKVLLFCSLVWNEVEIRQNNIVSGRLQSTVILGLDPSIPIKHSEAGKPSQ
ncbi:MAG: hypothetical protein Q4D82_05335 [Neisseria sp.]|nr:hypothetical protein [Neisseria sp.]